MLAPWIGDNIRESRYKKVDVISTPSSQDLSRQTFNHFCGNWQQTNDNCREKALLVGLKSGLTDSKSILNFLVSILSV